VHECYRRQTDRRQTTDGRAIAYSEREREFTFAKNGGTARPPQFSAHVYCGQTAGCSRIPLGRYGSRPRPRRHCVIWGPTSPPQFLAHVYCVQAVAWALVKV